MTELSMMKFKSGTKIEEIKKMDELSMMVKVGFTKLKVIKTKNEEIENSENCICCCLKSLIKQKLESNLGWEITN